MNKRTLAGLALVIAAVSTRPAGGQPVRCHPDRQEGYAPCPIVTPAWLAEHLHDSNLVLLEVGIMDGNVAFGKAHIPGAHYIDMGQASVPKKERPDSLGLEVPNPEVLRGRLAALGISDNSEVIVYFGGDGVSPATRVLLMLDYAGLGARSALLDGGMSAWTAAGQATTSSESGPIVPGRLSPLHVHAVITDLTYIRQHLHEASFHLIDARGSVFFDGVQEGSVKGVKGHIPGARNIPFNSVTDEGMHLKSPEQLAKMFADAGVGPRDTVVAYCHVGQQATAVLLAARSLGHPVLLYDGSFQDWGRHKELPVDDPSSSGRK